MIINSQNELEIISRSPNDSSKTELETFTHQQKNIKILKQARTEHNRFEEQLIKQRLEDAQFSQELFSTAPIDNNQTTFFTAHTLSNTQMATNATTSDFTLFNGPARFQPADKQDTRKRPRSLICHGSVDRILQRHVLQKVKEVGITPICRQKGVGKDFTMTFKNKEDLQKFECPSNIETEEFSPCSKFPYFVRLCSAI